MKLGRYRNGTCVECQKENNQTPERRRLTNASSNKYYQNNLRQIMLDRARARAREKGVECTITIDDILVPEVCPLLGLKLQRSAGSVRPASPSLDRKNPTYGYVPGNVWVISHRANYIKSNATLAELRTLVKALEQYAP